MKIHHKTWQPDNIATINYRNFQANFVFVFERFRYVNFLFQECFASCKVRFG